MKYTVDDLKRIVRKYNKYGYLCILVGNNNQEEIAWFLLENGFKWHNYWHRDYSRITNIYVFIIWGENEIYCYKKEKWDEFRNDRKDIVIRFKDIERYDIDDEFDDIFKGVV